MIPMTLCLVFPPWRGVKIGIRANGYREVGIGGRRGIRGGRRGKGRVKKRSDRRRRKKWGQTPNLQVMQHLTMKRNQISSPRSEPKCKEMEDTCDSGVRPKPDSS
ncbi:hypothetical protein Tco_1102558 [Tanacetum coccineum]